MPASPLIPCLGLMTDANKLQAPRGALRRAENVVIDAVGVASARPNFELQTAKADAWTPRAMHMVESGVAVVARENAGPNAYRIETLTGAVTGEATPPQPTISATQFAKARENLYYTTRLGPYKLTGSAAAAALVAGLKEVPSGVYALSSPTGTALETAFAVGYRVCVFRKDVNELEVRSAPSPWMRVENGSGSTKDIALTFPIAADVIAGDTIEVYRSARVAIANTPSDELALVATYTVVAGDVVVGLVPILDKTPEGARGRALYTSGTREGVLNGNFPPPVAMAMALFAGCVFYGNISNRHSLALHLLRVDTVGETGLSFRATTSTGTAPDAFVVVADPTGIHAGMYLHTTDPEAASVQFSANTLVTSVAGTTINLNKPILASHAGTNVRFSDRLTIDGTNFFSTSTTLWAAGTKYFPIYSTGAVAADIGKIVRILGFQISVQMSSVYAYGIEDPTSPGALVIRREVINAASFAWSTSAPAGSFISNGNDPTTSSQTVKPHRSYYSKPDEPEHVPVTNYIDAGDERSELLAYAALPDALLVFKTDGIWAISGNAPNFWRLDPVAAAVRLLHPQAVAVHNGYAYAWTDAGLLQIGAHNVVANLSDKLIGDDLLPYSRLYDVGSDTHGCFVQVWAELGLVLLGVADKAGDVASIRIYVFNLRTRAWSMWPLSWTCAHYDARGQALRHSFALLWEVRASIASQARGYDRVWSCSGWTYTAGALSLSISDAQRANWTPRAGDFVVCTIAAVSVYRRVLTATDTGAAYTLTIESAFPAGAQTDHVGLEGAPAVIEWLANASNGQPGNGSLVREIVPQIDVAAYSTALTSGMRLLAGAQCEFAGVSTVTATPAFATVLSRPVRIGTPRAVARSSHFYPHLEINEIGFRWRCLGVVLVGERMSEKVMKS